MSEDHHVKAKKRKTEINSFSENVSYSEDTQLEWCGKKKKKNKYRHTEETFMEAVSSDNLSSSYSHNGFVNYVVDNLEQKSLNWRCDSNTQKSPKKNKKKKRVEVCPEETLDETNHADQPSVFDNHIHLDEVTDTLETLSTESAGKKKKRHRPVETKNQEEDVLKDIQPSSLITLNENIDLENSVRKKKKKHRHSETRGVEDNALEEIQPSPLSTLNENNDLEITVRKKKKKHRHSETSCLEDHALEDIQPSQLITLNETIALENSVRKKKKNHQSIETRGLEYHAFEDMEPSPLITLNENIDSENIVRKKKKKHRHSETSCLEDHALEDMQPSPLITVYENIELENLVRKKKKKHKHSETRSLEDHALEDVQASPLITLNENNDLENIVRKKKKKHRHSETSGLEEDALEDIQPSPLITLNENIDLENIVRKKKKKHRHSETSCLENHALEDIQPSPLITLNENNDLENIVRKKKKKHRHSETSCLKDHALEDIQPSPLITLNENTDLENIVRKKKKKHRHSETRGVGDDAIENLQPSPLNTLNENVDLENSGREKENDRDMFSASPKVTENSEVESEKESSSSNYEVSKKLAVSEAQENEIVSEATNSQTDEDDDMGSPAKKNKSPVVRKSERLRKPGIAAELEEPDRNAMKNTLHKKTSDPDYRSKQSGQPVSVSSILSSLPKSDLCLLEEYFPKIRSLSMKSVNYLVCCELKRIQAAKEKGIKFRTGPFDEEEDELIKKNVDAFMTAIGLESSEMLFHSYRFPNKAFVDELKKKYHFRERIAEGLYRTVGETYNRGTKLYDFSAAKGRYTKEELEKLQQAVAEYGNKWIIIGKVVGRNRKSVQSKATQFQYQVNVGKWNDDEINRLIEAVKNFVLNALKGDQISKQALTTVPIEMLISGIPWRQIQQTVKTRSWTVCKSRWNDIMLLRMNGGLSPCEGTLGVKTNIECIKWLYENAPDKGQVNWMAMMKAIGNIPPGLLQQRIYKLKEAYVPNWHNLSFKEIVHHLYTEVLPVMEAKLKVPLFQKQPDVPERKDHFLISEIFAKYEGNERKCLSKEFCSDSE